MPNPIDWYDANAASVADSYEALRPDRLHGLMEGLYPAAPALILDVGAGSGRDAAWLACLGQDVVAVEPAPALRAEAARRHAGPTVRWMADALPALPATLRLDLAFDVVLLSAIWQHVPPTCGDLWNLLPTHRLVNQREKQDRLPADGRLRAAGAAIQA